ncbi:MAG: HD domain-containing protein [Chthonomonadaceae bacterium]|nr:HD domain-containing protein [Chthonomonadaceae bacterium]
MAIQYVMAREVKEGMCVAQNICDDKARILIMRGQRLGHHHIVRMRKFGISGVFIDPDHGEKVVPPSRTEIRKLCEKVLTSSCEKLTQEFAAKKVTLDRKAITDCTDNLVEALMKAKKPLVTLLDIDTGSDRLMQHSVNTAVLATVLAIDLRVPEEMIKQLAVGMLFHDVGTIFFPEELMKKKTPPTADEVCLLRRHTLLGFEHLVRSDAISPIAANVVFRHHEMMNGSGYPEGVASNRLTTLMRIASVVETYDSLTSSRFGIPAVLPDVAITFIINHVNTLFAREVVLSLCKRIAIYPKGTAVQLSTGERGVVAGVLPTAPTRPIVLIQIDRTRRALKSPLIVDLSQERDYRIVRSAASIEALSREGDAAVAPVQVNPLYATLG